MTFSYNEWKVRIKEQIPLTVRSVCCETVLDYLSQNNKFYSNIIKTFPTKICPLQTRVNLLTAFMWNHCQAFSHPRATLLIFPVIIQTQWLHLTLLVKWQQSGRNLSRVWNEPESELRVSACFKHLKFNSLHFSFFHGKINSKTSVQASEKHH